MTEQFRTSKTPELQSTRFAQEAEALREVPAPSALNHNHVKPEEAESIAGMGWLKSFYETASESWDRLNKLRTTARPEMTATAHRLEVNRAFEQASKRVGQARDTAQSRLQESAAKYRNDLDMATGLATTGKHDAELRQVLREMPERKRYQALIGAIESGDVDTMRAALTAPALAVGIEADKLKNLRAAWTRKAAPELVANLQRIDKAKRQLTDGFDAWLTEGDKLAYRKEIEQAQKAAEQHQQTMAGFQSEGIA